MSIQLRGFPDNLSGYVIVRKTRSLDRVLRRGCPDVHKGDQAFFLNNLVRRVVAILARSALQGLSAPFSARIQIII